VCVFVECVEEQCAPELLGTRRNMVAMDTGDYYRMQIVSSVSMLEMTKLTLVERKTIFTLKAILDMFRFDQSTSQHIANVEAFSCVAFSQIYFCLPL